MRTGSILHRTGTIDGAAHKIDTSTGDTRTSTRVIGVGTGAVVGSTPASIRPTEVSANEFDRISEIARDRWRRTDQTAVSTDVPCCFTDRDVLRAHRIRARADGGSGVTGILFSPTRAIGGSTGRTSTTTGAVAIVAGASSCVANGSRVSTGDNVWHTDATVTRLRRSTACFGGRLRDTHDPVSQPPVETPR